VHAAAEAALSRGRALVADPRWQALARRACEGAERVRRVLGALALRARQVWLPAIARAFAGALRRVRAKIAKD
jgi:hypothetical protein